MMPDNTLNHHLDYQGCLTELAYGIRISQIKINSDTQKEIQKRFNENCDTYHIRII